MTLPHQRLSLGSLLRPCEFMSAHFLSYSRRYSICHGYGQTPDESPPDNLRENHMDNITRCEPSFGNEPGLYLRHARKSDLGGNMVISLGPVLLRTTRTIVELAPGRPNKLGAKQRLTALASWEITPQRQQMSKSPFRVLYLMPAAICADGINSPPSGVAL